MQIFAISDAIKDKCILMCVENCLHVLKIIKVAMRIFDRVDSGASKLERCYAMFTVSRVILRSSLQNIK